MEARVQKWGHSLALRIPSVIARHAGIHPGSRVEISEVNGTLVVTPLRDYEPTLDLLLADITPSNIHHEVSSGQAVGNEAW
jgi:antitoxin MazE